MEKQNAPGREAEGVECLLAGDFDAYSTAALRAQVLAASYHVRPEMVAMLAGLVFGDRP
jgi:hypothetical protein